MPHPSVPHRARVEYGPSKAAITDAINRIIFHGGQSGQEALVDRLLARDMAEQEIAAAEKRHGKSFPGALNILAPILLLPGWTEKTYRSHCRQALAGMACGDYTPASTPVASVQIVLVLDECRKKRGFHPFLDSLVARHLLSEAFPEEYPEPSDNDPQRTNHVRWWASEIKARVGALLSARQARELHAQTGKGLDRWGASKAKGQGSNPPRARSSCSAGG